MPRRVLPALEHLSFLSSQPFPKLYVGSSFINKETSVENGSLGRGRVFEAASGFEPGSVHSSLPRLPGAVAPGPGSLPGNTKDAGQVHRRRQAWPDSLSLRLRLRPHLIPALPFSGPAAPCALLALQGTRGRARVEPGRGASFHPR